MADPLLVVTAIGAGVAIVQPWATAAWNKFFRQGVIDTYVTGALEIGFGMLGPTIAIGGTLRALHRDVFVSRIELEVVREQDSSTHKFEWIAFRPHSIPLGPTAQQQMTLEIASGFMISPNAPRRFNVLFADAVTLREIAPPVLLAWEALREAKSSLSIFEGYEEPPTIQQLYQVFGHDDETMRQILAELDDKYKKNPKQIEAYSQLTRTCYWRAGDYRLSMAVVTTRPDRCFRSAWRFQLSEQDAKTLEFNVLTMLQAPLDAEIGFPARPWFFAYPPFQEASQAARTA